MNQEKIGKFIAECRKEKNLTQEELAEKLGITEQAVSKWERGKSMPDLSLFRPLCNELDISINELMSGEQIGDTQYIKNLEENIVSMMSDLEKRRKRKFKILIVLILAFIFITIIGRAFYMNYEVDVKFDKRVMNCEFTDNELIFYIKGQSVLNTYHTSRNMSGKTIYFFHSTINIYNKRRSNFEYSQSMARLLDNKEVQYGYGEWLDIDSKNIEVYYTDKSIQKVKKSSEQELKEIIENSYLMCKSNN